MNKTFYDFTVYKLPNTENFQEKISGTNDKGILIVFLDEQRTELEAFLKKIIASIKLDYEKDCLILRGSHVDLLPTMAQLKSQFTFKKTLIFGFKGKDLGLNIETPLYTAFVFNENRYLFADKLSIIENSVERKKALWSVLQSL
ncbi:MAG: hypothetical protein JNL70_10170 [Saprospiraceae bacterium]|nr:hypothetical protein [Saprospiraceae bacterium]